MLQEILEEYGLGILHFILALAGCSILIGVFFYGGVAALFIERLVSAV